MSEPRTAERAAVIHLHLQHAFEALTNARSALGMAGNLAADDYEHNGDSIKRAEAGAELTLDAVIRDLDAWRGYYEARDRHERGNSGRDE